jgi:hypothetical protein
LPPERSGFHERHGANKIRRKLVRRHITKLQQRPVVERQERVVRRDRGVAMLVLKLKPEISVLAAAASSSRCVFFPGYFLFS